MIIEAQIGNNTHQLELPEGSTSAQIDDAINHFSSSQAPQKSWLESNYDSAKETTKALGASFEQLPLGAMQGVYDATAYGADKLGFPETAQKYKGYSKSAGDVAADLQGVSNRFTEKHPIAGTFANLIPQLSQVAGMGVSLPGVVGGGAIMGAAQPQLTEEQQQSVPKGETALTRLLEPVARAGGGILEQFGVDPESRTGRALLQGGLGALTLGAGKGLGKVASLANKGTKTLVKQATKINPEAVQALKESGIDPTLQLAGDSWLTRSLSNSLSKVPVIGERLNDKMTGALNKLESNVEGSASKLGTAADAIEGGEALQRGLSSFKDKTGSRINDLYENRLPQVLPGETPAVIGATKEFSNNYLGRFSDAPNLRNKMLDPGVKSKAQAFLQDTTPQQISTKTTGGKGNMRVSEDIPKVLTEREINRPYSYNAGNAPMIDFATGKPIMTNPQVSFNTLKNLRSDIGEQAGKIDAPGAYKQMYGALSKDMEATAAATSPAAVKALGVANRYTRMAEGTKQKLQRFFTQNQDGSFKMAPEAAAKATRQELELLKRSIPKDDFDNFSAASLRDLGKATAGAQNATGEVFSANTFLTNWNKLGAKKQILFSDKQLSKELERSAIIANRFKNLGKAANTSNTTNNAISLGSAALLYLPKQALKYGGGAFAGARLMTSPKALKVINDYAYKPVLKNAKTQNQFTKQLARAAGNDPELQKDIGMYLDGIKRLSFEVAPEKRIPEARTIVTPRGNLDALLKAGGR